MMLAWVAFGVALIAIAAVLVRSVVRRPRRPGHAGSAEDALKRLYARGEIDAGEYRRRLEKLRR